MHRTKFLACVVLAFAEWVQAQGPVASLVGYWEGTLDIGAGKLRLALQATKADDGLYLGELVSVDQGNAEIPIGKAAVDGRSVTLEFPLVSGTFKGELSIDGSQLTGTWSQGAPLPLTFKRTGKGAAAEPPKQVEAHAPSPFGAPVDVVVPAQPIPFRGAGGQSHLIYELHITNFSPVEQNLTRIEVLGRTCWPWPTP
jgi:hypothetical protein